MSRSVPTHICTIESSFIWTHYICLLPQPDAPRKPLTVNWRDIKATIHKKVPAKTSSSSSKTRTTSTESESEDEPDLSPPEDGLRWLDGGLPDLSGCVGQNFNLEEEFDIKRYLHILSESVNDSGHGVAVTRDLEAQKSKDRAEDNRIAADVMAPEDDEWGSWA